MIRRLPGNLLIAAAFTCAGGVLFAADVEPAPEQQAQLVEAMQERDAILNHAGKLFTEGQGIAARQVIQDFLETHPDDLDARVLLGTILMHSQQYEEAGRLFDTLIEDNPGNLMLLNNYAWMLATSTDIGFRNPVRALALAQEALLLQPENYRVWSTLAEAHYVNGNFAKAVDVMKKGIDLALQLQAPPDAMASYREQLRKLLEAEAVMRLLE